MQYTIGCCNKKGLVTRGYNRAQYYGLKPEKSFSHYLAIAIYLAFIGESATIGCLRLCQENKHDESS
jgi:hypothetical protein